MKRRPDKKYELTAITITSVGYDAERCKFPVLSVPYQQEFFPYLGQILLLWSSVDQLLATVTERLCIRYRPDISVSKMSFHQRVELASTLFQIHFATAPRLQMLIADVIEGLTEHHSDRNLLVHGRLSFTNLNGGAIRAKNEWKGRITESIYDLEDVQDLFYSLSHDAGRLHAVMMGSRHVASFPYEISEEEAAALTSLPLVE